MFGRRMEYTSKETLDLVDAMQLHKEMGIVWNDPYIVPAGFLDEPYNTTLHRQLRFLRDFGKLVFVKSDGGFEYWSKCGETHAQNRQDD